MRKALMALALLAGCGQVLADVDRITVFDWHDTTPHFGGMSGLVVSPDGQRFTALSDRALITTGRIIRENGQITGLERDANFRLNNHRGRPIPVERRDSEGLAIGPDGTAYVSFEGEPARVFAYDTLTGAARALPRHPDFDTMQSNASLEALALDSLGRLYTLPERSGRANRPFPVYRFDGQDWVVAFDIPRRDSFLPVGLDFGPDGLFYLLERDFTGAGFRSRIRRFDANGDAEKVIWQTGNADYDNLEGISLWRDAAGDIRVTMVSDDNFRFFQQTQIVELVLTP